MGGIFPLQVGESRQILLGYGFDDAFFIGGVDDRQAAALKSGTGEPPAVNSLCFGHDLIQLDQFRGARFPIINGAVAAFKGNFTVSFDITAAPSLSSLFYPVNLTIPVLRPLAPVFVRTPLSEITSTGEIEQSLRLN